MPATSASETTVKLVTRFEHNFTPMMIAPSGARLQRGLLVWASGSLDSAALLPHRPATRTYRTGQDDEDEGRTAQTDADGDHVAISTNRTSTIIDAFSAGIRVSPTACVP